MYTLVKLVPRFEKKNEFKQTPKLLIIDENVKYQLSENVNF